MTVPKNGRPSPEHEIEVAVAVHIEKTGTVCAFEIKRMWLATLRISGDAIRKQLPCAGIEGL